MHFQLPVQLTDELSDLQERLLAFVAEQIDPVTRGADPESPSRELHAELRREVARLSEAAGFQGYVVACFGDPGAAGAKELVSIPVVGEGEPDGYNVWDSYMGMMATTPGDDVTPDSPPATDRETARMFGRRVAAATLRWKCRDPS